jgi:hypothetical protein
MNPRHPEQLDRSERPTKALGVASLLALLFFLIPHCASAAQTYQAKNVTVTGSAPLQAYLRETTGAGGVVHFDMWEVSGGAVVRNYDWDMTKLMHMIVVSDDLAYFDHIHPALQPNGHWTIDYTPASRGLHHIYLDGLPHGLGRQVFRFDVPIGTSAAATARTLHARGTSVQAGPYRVTLDPIDVPIGEISSILVTITKNGRPAKDLHPYLGAMAHGVFVGVDNLAYMHAHGMSEDMLNMASAQNDCGDGMMLAMQPLVPSDTIDPHFEFQILAPSTQNYNFWLQFVGGTTLYTAPFLITTR